MSALLCLALLIVAPTAHSQAIQDSRCYLMNGGAVESFFISEDTPVGSIIGTLSVNGDPDEERGDIALSLQERAAAVGVAPGSKNVTLLRPLDREERLGPASVYVNVRCDRRRTADPSFVIPVSVRVWDVNDNAPQWVGGPYRVRVSELTAAGARLLSAPARDPDQPGPHATVHYAVLPGPAAEYIRFAHELDSTIVLAKPLDYERVRNLTATLRARDGGSPPRHADTTLLVEVEDADDQNPRFSHEHYEALLPDDAGEGAELETSPGPVAARDGDEGIGAALAFSGAGPGADRLRVSRATGRLAATARLRDSLPLTVVIKATQIDNPDRYALATVSVRRREARGAPAAVAEPPAPAGPAGAGGASGVGGVNGSNGVSGAGGGAEPRGVKFTRREYSARLPEDTAVGTLVLTLNTSPQSDALRPLQFYVSDRGFLEKFAINSAGEVLLRQPLDYEAAAAFRYQVMVTDGATNDTASLNITVDDVNEWEPRFRYPLYEFGVDLSAAGGGGDAVGGGGGAPGAGGGPLRVGRLDVHDGDSGDTVTLTLRGTHAPLFELGAAGELWLRAGARAGAALNVSALHLVATAVDSGAPPRQSSVPVVVHVRGAGAGGAGAGAGGASGAGVLAPFAAALVLLALAVLALLVYICTVRRRSPKGGVAPAPHEAKGAAPPLPPSGSLQSVSAGASTILDSTSSLDLRQDHPNGRRSQRGAGPAGALGAAGAAGQAGALGAAGAAGQAGALGAAGAAPGSPSLMSDHLAGAAGRSGVAWPSSTIPARVKKLSWDDARHEEPRAVAEATNPALADQMNLTVYF